MIFQAVKAGDTDYCSLAARARRTLDGRVIYLTLGNVSAGLYWHQAWKPFVIIDVSDYVKFWL
jgi:hypothetical protein